MSDTDSFIEEVTEEVRRDRLFALMKRYGWIAIALVLLIVGGAAFYEYRKAQEVAAAQGFGDAMLAALEEPDAVKRAASLGELQSSEPRGQAVLTLLQAQASIDAGDVDVAKTQLEALSNNPDAPQIYRQVATLKALGLSAEEMSSEERRAGYETLIGGNPQLRLLAEEQIALIEIEEGRPDAALKGLSAIAADPDATAAMQRRVAQLIFALGGETESASGGEESDNG